MVFQNIVSLRIEFHGNFFECPFGDESSTACTAYTGDFVLDQLGLPQKYVLTGCLSLAGFVMFYILTTCLFLKFIPNNISFSKEVRKVGKDIGTAEAIEYVKEDKSKREGLTVRFVDFKLSVEKRALFRKTTTNILQSITVDFEPGSLNVVMGPSGSSHDFGSF